MPALTLPALRQAVGAVAPSRLPEFFQEIQDAFTQSAVREAAEIVQAAYREVASG